MELYDYQSHARKNWHSAAPDRKRSTAADGRGFDFQLARVWKWVRRVCFCGSHLHQNTSLHIYMRPPLPDPSLHSLPRPIRHLKSPGTPILPLPFCLSLHKQKHFRFSDFQNPASPIFTCTMATTTVRESLRITDWAYSMP